MYRQKPASFFLAFTGICFIAYNVNCEYPYFSYVLSGILFVDILISCKETGKSKAIPFSNILVTDENSYYMTEIYRKRRLTEKVSLPAQSIM